MWKTANTGQQHYMIHSCPARRQYVNQYLVPSMLLNGIPLSDIIIWEDTEGKGNLESFMQSLKSLQGDGYVWHLQDDILLHSDFKRMSEEWSAVAPVVCGYCYDLLSDAPAGPAVPAMMWLSFPCIKIDRALGRECASWFYNKGRFKEEYQVFVSTGKFDDTMFQKFLIENYGDKKITYGVKPNLVEHIDYLIGGSTVNKARVKKCTLAAFFDEKERINVLRDKIEGRHRNDKIAVYCGTRNVYEDMWVAAKSLIVNSSVDKIYFLIEDDEFPKPLPDCIETINVCNQMFFLKDGPNYGCRWSYMVMMRAALPFIFPQYNRVLSLDIDTIVDKDVDEIWDINLGDYYFSAAVQPDRCKGGKFWKKDEPNMYYNCGVVLFNLKKLRERKAEEVIKELNTKQYNFTEQDVLCKLCEGNILSLNNKFNKNNYTGRCFEEPIIIHFAGLSKHLWQNNDLVKKYKQLVIKDEETGEEYK